MKKRLVVTGMAIVLSASLTACVVAPPYGYAPAPAYYGYGYGYGYAPGYYVGPTIDIGIGGGWGGYRHGGWRGR